MKILMMIFFLVGTWAENKKVEIRLESQSTVLAESEVQLSQIVQSASNYSLETQELLKTALLEGIEDGEKTEWTQTEMAQLLAQKFNRDQVTFVIPAKVSIVAKSNYLSHKEIIHNLIQEAQKSCEGCEVGLREIKIPSWSSNDSIKSWKLDFSQVKLAGNFILPLKVQSRKQEHLMWVSGFLDVFREVPTARRNINMNEKIENEDVDLQRTNITFSKVSPAKFEDIRNHVSARMIPAGSPIYLSDLKKELSVQRGQIVKVIISGEAFEISSQGVAEEAGSVGDLVKIKIDQQKMMSGKIIDKGVVRIE